MSQQIITQEGTFNSTQRNQINENFAELYNQTTGTVQTVLSIPIVNSTTLVDLTGLSLSVEKGTYILNMLLRTDSTAGGGVKVAFHYIGAVMNEPLCMVTTVNYSGVPTISEFASPTNQASIISTTTAIEWVQVNGILQVANGGIIQVQGAQSASNAAATVFYDNSYFSLTKIG